MTRPLRTIICSDPRCGSCLVLRKFSRVCTICLIVTKISETFSTDEAWPQSGHTPEQRWIQARSATFPKRREGCMGEHYTHLDIRERAVIEMNLALGKRPAQIAVYLNRSRSTIARELTRNGWHAAYYDRTGRRIVAGGYRCEKADLRAGRLSRRARVERKLRPGTALWELMVKHLSRGLSPAQIESTLSRMPEPVQLSRETIYTSLYAMPKGKLRASLLALMRRRHKARKTQLRKNKSNNGAIPDMTLIDLRPVEI